MSIFLLSYSFLGFSCFHQLYPLYPSMSSDLIILHTLKMESIPAAHGWRIWFYPSVYYWARSWEVLAPSKVTVLELMTQQERGPAFIVNCCPLWKELSKPLPPTVGHFYFSVTLAFVPRVSWSGISSSQYSSSHASLSTTSLHWLEGATSAPAGPEGDCFPVEVQSAGLSETTFAVARPPRSARGWFLTDHREVGIIDLHIPSLTHMLNAGHAPFTVKSWPCCPHAFLQVCAVVVKSKIVKLLLIAICLAWEMVSEYPPRPSLAATLEPDWSLGNKNRCLTCHKYS